jgi:hypothetical protein
MRRSLVMPVRIVLILVMATTALYAGDWYDQLWPETDVFVGTGQHSRLFFLVAGTRTKPDGYSDGQLGVHMDFYLAPLRKSRAARRPDIARDKFLMVRVGYLFGKTPHDSPNPFTEHTLLIEMTPRYFLPKGILLSDRNRGDLRFLDGAFVPRYRNRLKVERTFQLGKRALTPYAHAELFYDWRYNAFTRQRYSAGGELEINKRVVLEAYYLRQEDSRASVKGTNVLGLGLQLYFQQK